MITNGHSPRRPARPTLVDIVTMRLQRDEAEQRLELAAARLAAAVAHLAAIVALVRAIGGYMTAEDQQRLRAAQAWLAEMGHAMKEGM